MFSSDGFDNSGAAYVQSTVLIKSFSVDTLQYKSMFDAFGLLAVNNTFKPTADCARVVTVVMCLAAEDPPEAFVSGTKFIGTLNPLVAAESCLSITLSTKVIEDLCKSTTGETKSSTVPIVISNSAVLAPTAISASAIESAAIT